MLDFRFFLIHKEGYRVLGARRTKNDGYVMYRVLHPNAQVYDTTGERKLMTYFGDVDGDEIQMMLESGEWDIARSSPFEMESGSDGIGQEDESLEFR